MNENIFDATLVIYIFASLINGVNSFGFVVSTLLHSERPKLQRVLDFLSATGFRKQTGSHTSCSSLK